MEIKKIESLSGTANAGDRLVEGYCVKLDNEDFNIFVMDEMTGSRRGFSLKIMYKDGTDNHVNISDKAHFPQVYSILNRYCTGMWKNRPNAKKCYRYVVFGKEEVCKIFAIVILRQIVLDIIVPHQ
jgi:hypothetical protein